MNKPLPVLSDAVDVTNKRVFVRAELNVPVVDGKVINDFRLQRGMPTLQYLVEKGAKIILVGHIGRDPENTLAPVYEVLKKHFDISFASDVGGNESAALIESMQPGQVVLLENLRQHPGEKANDTELAKQLAALADMYVSGAFSVAHRAHASTVGVPTLLPAYASFDFAAEIAELEKASQPDSPALFMLGGAKFDTKMPLVEKFLNIYDHVFVGGALANDFFKGKGFEIGESLVSDVDLSGSPLLTDSKILLPVDVTVAKGDVVRTCAPEEVAADERILDAGPATTAMLTEYINNAKMVLWNGPLGDYEHGFGAETEACAAAIAAAPGYSVIGGGDTVAAIEALGLEEQFNFLSTAGGAMLEFLEKGTLPAIEALR